MTLAAADPRLSRGRSLGDEPGLANDRPQALLQRPGRAWRAHLRLRRQLSRLRKPERTGQAEMESPRLRQRPGAAPARSEPAADPFGEGGCGPGGSAAGQPQGGGALQGLRGQDLEPSRDRSRETVRPQRRGSGLLSARRRERAKGTGKTSLTTKVPYLSSRVPSS